MKIFVVNKETSGLADKESRMLYRVMSELLTYESVQEVYSPDDADAVIIQERSSYKDFRYINDLLKDPIINKYIDKVFTINRDDCATGLLRGLYTSLPKSRYNPKVHVAVPYMEFPNELIFSKDYKLRTPAYLATWRGNTKSNKIRLRMIESLKARPEVRFETTDSWLNHQLDEKESYVDLMLNAKFSLCPAGWAPVSFRIYESMALGRCPVILADDFVPPSGPDWSEFALFYPQKRVSNLYNFLREQEPLSLQLGEKAQAAWKNFFGPQVVKKYYAQALFSLISSTPVSSKDNEIKRWNSFDLYWNNKWTIPQRILNKARNMSRAI